MLGDWQRTDSSPTRSGPEGSSRNEISLGRLASLPTVWLSLLWGEILGIGPGMSRGVNRCCIE